MQTTMLTETPAPKLTKKAQDEANKLRMHEALDKSAVFVERALLALYERQTADEQQIGATSHHNAVGFGGADAEFLSSVAERVIVSRNQYRRVEGNCLSLKQRLAVAKCLKKYWRQLAEIAAEKKAAKAKPAE